MSSPKVMWGEIHDLSLYAADRGPLTSRLQMFINNHQGLDDQQGCFVRHSKIAVCLGCSVGDIRTAIARLKKKGWIVRVTWDGGHRWGYRTTGRINDAQLAGFNAISPNSSKVYCRPDDVVVTKERIREEFDSRKVFPSIYPFDEPVKDSVLRELNAQSHWQALGALWDVDGFGDMLDPDDKGSRGWWKSLMANVRKNNAPWTDGLDGDLLLQVGMLNAADHIMRKVNSAEGWVRDNPPAVFCKILQTLGKKDDKKRDVFSIVDASDVMEDMETLSEHHPTVREALTKREETA